MTLVAIMCAWCTKTISLSTSNAYASEPYVESHTACEACQVAIERECGM